MLVLLTVAGAAHAQVASDWILDTTTPVLEPDTSGVLRPAMTYSPQRCLYRP